ncbi:MAG TPA: hypothetical protein VGD24_04560 [Gallionella sp.]
MKITYDKNEVIAAARYILENNPSTKIPSEIPHTARGYQPERGYVGAILDNIRTLAKNNAKVYEAAQRTLASADKCVVWCQWIEVIGVGGYWIIANVEDHTMDVKIAISPWFGEPQLVEEEVEVP